MDTPEKDGHTERIEALRAGGIADIAPVMGRVAPEATEPSISPTAMSCSPSLR